MNCETRLQVDLQVVQEQKVPLVQSDVVNHDCVLDKQWLVSQSLHYECGCESGLPRDPTEQELAHLQEVGEEHPSAPFDGINPYPCPHHHPVAFASLPLVLSEDVGVGSGNAAGELDDAGSAGGWSGGWR